MNHRRASRCECRAMAAHHAVGESVIKLERRADGERKLSYAHRIAVAQLDDGQIFRLDLDHRDIGLFICADDFRWKLAAIFQFYVDFVGGFDDVEICQDVAIWPNDETRAFALDWLRTARVASRSIFVGRPLEK